MCGVIGIAAVGELDKKQEKLRQEVMIFLATELLLLTQPRGKEATGMAALFGNNDYIGLKMGIPAADFISRLGGTKEDFDGFMKLWRGKKNPAKMFIGHCRQPTTGGGAPPEDNENNHPVKIGNTIGVHNGTLKNDDIVFENLGCKRDGKVDSEAIFRLTDHVIEGGNQPWTTEALQEVAHHLEGSFTVLMFHANNPYQLAAMRDGRPLEVVYIKPFKLMVLASDKDFLKGALFKYNKFAAITNFGITGLPVLHKKDLIWKGMPDRTTFLMDIRNEPEQENPIISDFFDEGIIKFESQRDWQTPTKTYNNNRHQQTQWPNRAGGTGCGGTGAPGAGTKNTGGNGVKKAEVQASSSKGSKTKDESTDDDDKESKKRPAGFIWKNERSSYVPVGGKVSDRQAAGLKNVVLDAETNSVEQIPNEVIMDAENKESAEEVLDVKKSPAAVKCLPMPEFDLSPANVAVPERLPQGKEVKIVVINTERAEEVASGVGGQCSRLDREAAAHMDAIRKEVKVKSTDPKVLETAWRFANSLERFETEEEVIDALGIVDVETLRQIQVQHIANRVIRTFAANHYYEGYVAGQTEKSGAAMTIRDLGKELRDKQLENDALAAARRDKSAALRLNSELMDKKMAAESRVRVLKAFCSMLLEFVEDRALELDPPDAYEKTWQPLREIILEKMLNGKEIDSEKLKKVFTKGDRIDLPIINTILKYINELETNDLRLREESLNGTA